MHLRGQRSPTKQLRYIPIIQSNFRDTATAYDTLWPNMKVYRFLVQHEYMKAIAQNPTVMVTKCVLPFNAALWMKAYALIKYTISFK